MPPETDRGARVFVLEPMRTPESASEVKTELPEPLGTIFISLLFPDVEMVLPVSVS